MFGRPALRVVVCAFSLVLVVATTTSGQETLRRDHSRFYRSGSTLDINEVVGLEKAEGGRMVTVTIGYNMTRSKLEVDWVCNGEVLQHSKLDQGMDKEITYTFNRPLPASFEARFSGPDGQVQVRWVSAVTAPLQAGEAMIVQGVPPEQGEITGFEPTGGQVGVVATPVVAEIDPDSLYTPVELAPFVRRVEIEPLTIRPGATATGRVVLGAQARKGGFVVPLLVRGPKAASVHVPEEVVVRDGLKEVEFEIKADPAADNEAAVGRDGSKFTIGAEGGLRGAPIPQRTAQVLQPELESLRLEPKGEVRAGDTAYLTLILADPASPGGTVVSLTAKGSPEEVAQVPEKLWIEEGETGTSLEIDVGATSSGFLTIDGRSAIMTLQTAVDIRFGVPIASARLEPPWLRPGTAVDLVVELEEPAMVGGATISLDVTGEGATWVDVAPETVIEEGETRGTFNVSLAPLSGGQLAAAQMADLHARFVVFELSTPVTQKGHPIDDEITAQGSISQVEVKDLSFADSLVPAGQAAVATITLEEPASPGGTYVWLTHGGFAADHATVPEEIHFSEGDSAREIEVPIDLAASDLIPQGSGIWLEVRSNDRGVRRGVSVVYPTWVESMVVEPEVIPIAGSFTFTVTMKEPVPWDDFSLMILAAEEGWQPNSSSNFPALNCVKGDGPTAIPKGETTVTIDMSVYGWCEFEGPITIWATSQRIPKLEARAAAEIVILPEIETFIVSGEETVLPGSTVRFHIQLSKPAPTGGVRIQLPALGSSVQASWPEEIVLNRGVRGAHFDVVLAPDETGSFGIEARIFSGEIGWSRAMKRITVQSE